MNQERSKPGGHCQCGAARFFIEGRPLIRAYCHCLICQAFNQADFADITVFYDKDVVLEQEESVSFRVHKQPPMLRRGCCKQCGGPSIERVNIPFLPRLTVVPSQSLKSHLRLQPALHIFYHRRRSDVNDNLPKYSGFLSSQTHFGIAVARAMFRAD